MRCHSSEVMHFKTLQVIRKDVGDMMNFLSLLKVCSPAPCPEVQKTSTHGKYQGGR
jgi:hypothetical protein